MVTTNGYDRIAFVYDFIAKIFSFDQINRSQLGFLSHLSTQQTCLILGGGTGYFLQKLLETNNTVHVTYVDASAKMIVKAQQRIHKNIPSALERVTFISKRVEEFEFDRYDVIVCNYFLDLFDDAYVGVLAGKFKQNLHAEGLLYVTDFDVPNTNNLLRWCTKLGLKILYSIHRRVTTIKTFTLPEIEKNVNTQNFNVVCYKKYLLGVLKCSVYQIN